MTTDNNTVLLPVADTLASAWNKVKGTKASIWAAFGIMLLISIGFFILNLITKNIPVLAGVIGIFGQVINYLLQMGMIYIGIQRAFELPINYRMIFRPFQSPYLLNLILFYLLEIVLLLPFVIIIIAGAVLMTVSTLLSILFYIVGIAGIIYLAVRLSLGVAYIQDKDQGPWTAVKSSFKATSHNFWRLVAVIVLEMIIIMISAIPLGIGLIWTIPFGFIVYGEIYKRLLPNTEAVVTTPVVESPQSLR